MMERDRGILIGSKLGEIWFFWIPKLAHMYSIAYILNRRHAQPSLDTSIVLVLLQAEILYSNLSISGVIKPQSVSFHPSVNGVFPLYCMYVAKQIHPRRNFGLKWSRGIFSVWRTAWARVAAPLSRFFFPMYAVDARNSIIVYIFRQISPLYLTIVRFRVRKIQIGACTATTQDKGWLSEQHHNRMHLCSFRFRPSGIRE